MNKNQRRVVLYGDSLILAGVRAGLESCPDLQVLFLDRSLEESLDAIRACCPATFIFDMDAVQPDFQFSLLQQPGLLLVGIDPKTHQALVWSGQPARAYTTEDLLTVIQQHDPDKWGSQKPIGPCAGSSTVVNGGRR